MKMGQLVLLFPIKYIYIYDEDHMSDMRVQKRSEGDLLAKLHSSVGGASHWYHGGHGFESQNFFWALFVTA